MTYPSWDEGPIPSSPDTAPLRAGVPPGAAAFAEPPRSDEPGHGERGDPDAADADVTARAISSRVSPDTASHPETRFPALLDQGRQAGVPLPPGPFLRFTRPPPSGSMIQTSKSPARSDWNASSEPSGDQAENSSRAGSFVRFA